MKVDCYLRGMPNNVAFVSIVGANRTNGPPRQVGRIIRAGPFLHVRKSISIPLAFVLLHQIHIFGHGNKFNQALDGQLSSRSG